MNEPPSASHKILRPFHGLLLLFLFFAALLVPALHSWPAGFLVPLAVYFLFVAVVPPLRRSFKPWRFGRPSRFAIAATLIVTVVSSVVLIIFHTQTHPDISVLRALFPQHVLGSVILAGALFSVLNALLEEAIFRGVFFDAIEASCGVWIAVITTAIIFGYGHMKGYPPGPLGAVLAGIYGLALAWLRVISGGLGMPFLAHIVADATIYYLVARSDIS